MSLKKILIQISCLSILFYSNCIQLPYNFEIIFNYISYDNFEAGNFNRIIINCYIQELNESQKIILRNDIDKYLYESFDTYKINKFSVNENCFYIQIDNATIMPNVLDHYRILYKTTDDKSYKNRLTIKSKNINLLKDQNITLLFKPDNRVNFSIFQNQDKVKYLSCSHGFLSDNNLNVTFKLFGNEAISDSVYVEYTKIGRRSIFKN